MTPNIGHMVPLILPPNPSLPIALMYTGGAFITSTAAGSARSPARRPRAASAPRGRAFPAAIGQHAGCAVSHTARDDRCVQTGQAVRSMRCDLHDTQSKYKAAVPGCRTLRWPTTPWWLPSMSWSKMFRLNVAAEPRASQHSCDLESNTSLPAVIRWLQTAGAPMDGRENIRTKPCGPRRRYATPVCLSGGNSSWCSQIGVLDLTHVCVCTPVISHARKPARGRCRRREMGGVEQAHSRWTR